MHYGRFVVGFGHGGRGAPHSRDARLRYWRVDQAARAFLRRDRIQADLWTCQPRQRALPLSFTLDTVGPLALSAEDAGAIMGIIAGPDPLDPTTLGAPAWNAKATRVPP